MRDSETVIYWLFIHWKSAVALKTPICPHVWFFSPHCSLLTITWSSQWPGLMTWNTSHLYFFTAPWFITSYSTSTEGRTGFICEEIVFCIMLLKRPDSLCTWPSMSVNVSAIHCQFCKSEPLLFFLRHWLTVAGSCERLFFFLNKTVIWTCAWKQTASIMEEEKNTVKQSAFLTDGHWGSLHLKGRFKQKRRFCHHLLTLVLLQSRTACFYRT